MNRETIEKAATHHANMMGWDHDPEEIRGLFAHSFKAGAEWRINSVWHDGNEEPQRKDEYLLVEYRDWGSDESNYDVVAVEEFEIYADRIYSDLIRWLYISDLLPDRKEARP